MSRFQTTRWSLIQAANDPTGQARAALEQLCRAYRPPVLAFVRSSGHSQQDAEDLTQAFFFRFLERGWYAEADPRRGRFRSLLLTQLRRFLIDHHRQTSALKRSGHHVDESMLALISDDGEAPERAFTRVWMETVVSRTLDRLEAEWKRNGKQAQFQQLAALLLEQAGSLELSTLSLETGIRPGTLSVQLHRMRQRMRQLVQLELLQTVGSREALEHELADLRSALES